MFNTFKKELFAIPLDNLYQTVSEAGKRVKDSLVKDARSAHDRRIARLIEATYAGREESYEGNQEEDYPFSGPDSEYVKVEADKAKVEAFKLWAEKYDLHVHANWFLPQLVAHIAKMPTCGYNSAEYAASFGVDDFHKGIWALAMHPTRGDIVPKQYSAESRNYSALVPLLLMPHKKFDHVDYSKWTAAGLNLAVDPNLHAAMTCDFEHDMSTTEILEIREKALTFKTGKTIGQVRNAQTSHKVYSLEGPLKKLPWLVQVMLFQIWCAHPVNRTDLMVLDWKNWDNMPEPLVTKELFKPTVASKTATPSKPELPWDY